MPSERTFPVPDDAVRGVLWMMLATMLWTGSDVIVKHFTRDFSLVQILWARYTFHVVAMALLFGQRLPRLARARRPGLQMVRSSLTLVSTMLYFAALRYIGVADANAVFAVAPIAVAVLAVPLLGERVGLRRWVAVAVGFAGALVIIRPGTDAMHPAALLIVAAAGINAFYQIATRILGRSDSALTTMVFTPLAGWAGTTLAVPFFWTEPDAAQWALMALLGVCSGGGHSAMVKAFEAAPAAIVSPFLYACLIWATLFGFLAFGDFPDAWTIAGAGLLAASGIYIIHRERVRAAAAREAADRG